MFYLGIEVFSRRKAGIKSGLDGAILSHSVLAEIREPVDDEAKHMTGTPRPKVDMSEDP